MRESPRGLSFNKKALPVLGFILWLLTKHRNRFNRNEAIDLGVSRFIHNSHRAAANFREDLVTAKICSCQRAHAFRQYENNVMTIWLNRLHGTQHALITGVTS